MTSSEIKALPQPPQIKRTLEMGLAQRIGLLLLMAIPVLAVLGIFGESFEQVTQSSEDLSMTVEYATRYRYKMINNLSVDLVNESDQTLPVLSVSFSRDYIDQFSTVTFTPSVKEITGTAYIVELTEVAPGESRSVQVELQGERYGQHQGAVGASAEGIASVELQLTTFIFP